MPSMSRLPTFHLRAEVRVRSLKVGQRLTGIIRDIGNFGLFVDVGAQRDGLVRYSNTPGWFCLRCFCVERLCNLASFFRINKKRCVESSWSVTIRGLVPCTRNGKVPISLVSAGYIADIYEERKSPEVAKCKDQKRT